MSPAAFAPLRQAGTFLADSGVVTVAWIDHRVVAVHPEDPAFQVVHEGLELSHICCPSRAAGEQTVAGGRSLAPTSLPRGGFVIG